MNFLQSFKRIAFFTSWLLLALNVVGQILPVTIPSRITSAAVVIPGFDVATRNTETLTQLINAPVGHDDFQLDEATMMVCLSLRHSDERFLGLCENWLAWSLGQIYSPAARTQDVERLVLGGAANCSERCQILQTLAEKRGLASRFVGLNGHVVLEVQTPQGWRVTDPDFGVVYPCEMRVLQSEPGIPLIEHLLQDRGFSPETIRQYTGWFQSAHDNVTLEIGSRLSPRLWKLETLCNWLVWVIPTVLLIGSTVRWPSVRPKVRLPSVDDSSWEMLVPA